MSLGPFLLLSVPSAFATLLRHTGRSLSSWPRRHYTDTHALTHTISLSLISAHGVSKRRESRLLSAPRDVTRLSGVSLTCSVNIAQGLSTMDSRVQPRLGNDHMSRLQHLAVVQPRAAKHQQQHQKRTQISHRHQETEPEPEPRQNPPDNDDDRDDDLDSLSTVTAPFPEYSEVEAEAEAERARHSASSRPTSVRSFQPPQLALQRHPLLPPWAIPMPHIVAAPMTILPPKLHVPNNRSMQPVSGPSDAMRGMVAPNVSNSITDQGSSPIYPNTTQSEANQANARFLNYTLSSTSPLASLAGNVSTTAYHSHFHSGSSSSTVSGSNSSRVSSTVSAIVNPSHDDRVHMGSHLAPVNFHASELAQENSHVRSTRELISESTTSSLSANVGQLHGGQCRSSSYVLGPPPTSSGYDGYASAPSGHLGVGSRTGFYHGLNSTIWNSSAPNTYGGTVSAPALPPYSAPAPVNSSNSLLVTEPIQMYRATTHPIMAPRVTPDTQRNARSNGFSHAQFGYSGYNNPHASYGPLGSRLNANAAEFNHETSIVESWNPSPLGKHVYLHPAQQINWRQLLEPGVTADWDLIVDKIISNNDQQASIFLQQKIKNSDTAIKDDIIGSIIRRGLELMGNRFGNFLIQRVFECANQAQIVGLAAHIEGHTVRLSTDAFGCHVIQKAFDCVPESFKHQMVRELLSRIRDTIVHRYACHVWQKLFELRWQGPPPMIMGTVNAALVGQWTQVAVGETGSLVVQNIFENCNDEDKRPCIDEVLANLDYIARGQYGNWCIQHICEHGSPHDRDVAISMILSRAADYSMDQYASKCIEKCLKVCGSEFLDRYLQQILVRAPGENFSPLVQIARDQYGNFLIQWILNNASPHLREIVQAEIRKHLVSLRGNKYGSKVALSCGYGPQGVRPGVPFASAHFRHHNGGPRISQQQNHPFPNHSSTFPNPYQVARLDGAARARSGIRPIYVHFPSRAYPPNQYNSGAGLYN
ncbi:uncharacterized protein PV09_09172 [Verruconis gallopava]|uniref:PUM-HD domain-containing protein n=1 Tax=Verruconis gallopava TaxID=253628 RepID=A0A0D1YEJ2_9PEZI|nr:uncharacterized protein PV09_09172 [Verruconis gallopava]KIV99141.1 hypothetical protein PV09_09172 [Verruconis gallopava]